ncbi:unnamed protein product [Rotaria sp. Silwood1]|nr:unnamed protein product [Rotaria sp. Silwood1]CAF3416960.1 unnamed protein product [Rotaria sp. Silwood1]CAF4514924.1 unnamed protein product [Rotaria sp. Silwood1]
MAQAPGRTARIICGKEKVTFLCGGCTQEFCFNHLADHKQELSKQFDEVEVNHDFFRQILTEQTSKPQQHPLIQQIDTWEYDSINKIQQKAEKARQLVLTHIIDSIRQIENKLNQLTDKIRQSRAENDFFETDLHGWNDDLIQLKKKLTKPSNINARHDTTQLVTTLSIDVTSYKPVRRWKPEDTNGIIVAGGSGEGDRLDQLSGRFHIFVYNDQSIYVSDEHNHRVMKWMKDAKEGIVVAGGNGPGNSLTQLWASIGVAVDQLDTIYIADSNNHRIIRWPQEVKQGSIVVDENGKEEQANQLSSPLDLTFDQQGNLYVVDNGNYRVQRFNIDIS